MMLISSSLQFNYPTDSLIMDIESHRTQNRAAERALRSPNLTEENLDTIAGSCLATVANAELLSPGSSFSIHSDYLCPISQLVPEDAVIFGGTLYERSSADSLIRDALRKRLSWRDRARCVKDPLNPSRIIYSCKNREAVTNEAQILNIINYLVKDVDYEWYTKLETEVERARSATPTTNRGNDGKLIVVSCFVL